MTTYLLANKRLLVAVVMTSSAIGLLATVANVGTNLAALKISAASAHVLVDTDPPLVERSLQPADFRALVSRTALLAQAMSSPPVLRRVAAKLNVPADRMGGETIATDNVAKALTDPDSEKRASDILRTRLPYRLEVQARPGRPIVDVYAQAPSPAEARRFADTAAAGLRDFLRALAARQGHESSGVALRQLGPARGGVVNSKAPLTIAVLTFLTGFGLSAGILLLLIAVRRGSPARALRHPAAATAPTGQPEHRSDDWPHTTRLLPWMLAGFMALLWLLPFNAIELNAALPIDLKLDRLVLPFIVVAWLASMIAGGISAPRLRFTRIHAAVGAFVVCATLSVVLDARYLNQTLELDASLKRIPLLISYVALFFITASVVRRSEVWAYTRYTLILAAICSIGIVWEYRFKTNLFYDLSDKLLPGIFNVGLISDASGIDDIGRRAVIGPAELPLEAVAMLSMVLPIGVVFVMQSKEWRSRILTALAVCLLLAATIATFRKSALVAPISAVLTLAYFRRRELLKLAPLGLVLIVVIHVLAPGALGSTAIQFDANRLGVSTVSDRTVDYDAIRPDVWTNLAFGRGWGSYNHVDYRLLDSEILHRLVEMGVIGLLAFLAMGIAVVAATRKLIAARDPKWSPLALIGAAAAVPFVVASALFDVLSFPHATYIFLYLAGLTSVIVARRA